ncbi:MAG: 50S ribosomal protein L17 [Planctomycetes bacterium]|nr:50S ribosomal protein L17 [Planctomycetota bacterium]
MRHRVAGRRLSRTSEHRLAMRRNLVASLFEHETVSTTIEKAKEVKPFAERLITLAKKGTLAARRRAIALLGNRDIVEYEDGKAVRKGTVIGKLFSDIGPRYLDRPGGYTRIIRLSLRRLGDNGQLVLLQLIGEGEGPKKKAKSASKKRSRRKAKEAARLEQTTEAEQVAEPKEVSEAEGADEPKETPQAQETDQAEDQQSSEATDETDRAEEKE